MTANEGEHMQEQNDPTMEPTSEYTMRHAANFLAAMARNSGLRLAEDDIKTIDFAYQQLLRGANTLQDAKAQAWEEGAVAGWKQSGEGFNAEHPDESQGGCSVDLSANPYRNAG